jgi:hypothetical protein
MPAALAGSVLLARGFYWRDTRAAGITRQRDAIAAILEDAARNRETTLTGEMPLMTFKLAFEGKALKLRAF